MNAGRRLALSGAARWWTPLRDDRVRARLVAVAGTGWAGITAVLVGQAWRGRPLLAPDALTLGAGVAVLVGVAIAAIAVTTGPRCGQAVRPR